MKTRAVGIWADQLFARGLSRNPRSASTSTTALRTFFTSTRPGAKSRLPPNPQAQGLLSILRCERSALARRFRFLRFKSQQARSNPSQRPNPTPHLGSPEPAPSLSQRLKNLSREYGWTAVGVYFALSALDFPFCFLAVRLLGTDRIGHYEEIVKNAFWSLVQIPFPSLGHHEEEPISSEQTMEATAREGSLALEASNIKNGTEASIWTQLGLAYIVHKSFIFIRIPLTAAVLPKVVKTLRGWGYNIGKRTPKPN